MKAKICTLILAGALALSAAPVRTFAAEIPSGGTAGVEETAAEPEGGQNVEKHSAVSADGVRAGQAAAGADARTGEETDSTQNSSAQTLQTDASDADGQTGTQGSSGAQTGTSGTSGAGTGTGTGDAGKSSGEQTGGTEEKQTTFNVLSYGADRTGKENAAAAFRAALQAAGKAGTDEQRATVEVPSGTYLLADTMMLIIYSNTNLKLADDAVIKVQFGLQFYAMLTGAVDANNPAGGYDQLRNVTISGGVWDANNSVEPKRIDSKIMNIRHAQNIRIENTTLKNNNGRHVLYLNGVMNAVVSHVRFEDCTRWEGQDDPENQEALFIGIANQDVIESDETKNDAKPLDNTGCDNVTVDSCTFSNVVSGIGQHTVGGTLTDEARNRNITITNNTFKDLEGDAMNLGYMVTGEVSGNTMTHIGVSGISVLGSESMKIQNNTADKVTAEGISVSGSDATEISGNRVSGANNGIVVTDSKDTAVSGNTLQNNTSCGLYLAGDSGTKTQKNLISGTLNGISARGSENLTAESNRVTKCGSFGMYLSDVSGASVTDNEVSAAPSANNSYGIFVSGAQKVSVNRNLVLAAGRPDIGIWNCTGAEVTDNSVVGDVSSRIQGSTGFVPGNNTSLSFSDVARQSSYYYAPVYWAKWKNVASGTSKDTFSPSEPCTRGQIMAFLYNALGSPVADLSALTFDDLTTAWQKAPVAWAVANGITSGTGPATFSPNATCTRAQAMTFLWKAAGSPEPSENASTRFVDVPADKYYAKAVSWAVENGITSGFDTTHFGSNEPCTRGQIMTFVYLAYFFF